MDGGEGLGNGAKLSDDGLYRYELTRSWTPAFEGQHLCWVIRRGSPPRCLEVTKDGHPRHPLYVAGKTEPKRFVLDRVL